VSANRRTGSPSTFEREALAEAERSGHPFLVFRDGDEGQRLYVFEPGTVRASVGRAAESDVALDWDSQVSRLHARFDLVDGVWVLSDDGLSRNGTYVNGERLHGARRLNDGDSLRFGATSVTFRAPRRGRIEAARPAEAPSGAAASVTLSTTQRRVLAALCRPYRGGSRFASPATDAEIAEEMVLSAGEVRAHLRVLCAKLGLTDASDPDPRVRLVERAFSDGLVSESDL